MHISVIIPTCGRLRELSLCLQGLEKQTLKPDEIIVVNDSMSEIAVSGNVKLVKAKTKLGAAGAKNMGAKIARGEILAFLDDDCVPHPNWLEFLARPFKSQKISVAAGRIKEKRKAVLKRNWRDLILNLPFYPFYFLGRKKVGGAIYFNGRVAANLDVSGIGFCDWGGAGNLAARKDFFIAAGGFDSRFLPGPSLEEPDLCLRIKESGGAIFYQGQAVVSHNPSAFGRLAPDIMIQNLRANEVYFGLKNIAFRGPLEFFGFFLYQAWQILIYFILILANRKYWLRIKGKAKGLKYYLAIR
ncbi:hypothetical protein COT68_02065 [bacterium (Candidatus Torokbacteria) CG09_land_8_20_14_0_10_42_11]|nr:MAG: hypothetical protein COT68_02065 [bacterium (Candidatus Torokbacteria) CG09_land_8_20_14_0_10_42_11]